MPAPNAPSMKEVAARAGVSLGTVSNVLNRPAVVTETTRARVQAAIEELGFVRNDSARQLRAGRSRTMGYVVIDASNPFFTDVGRGVAEAADAEGLAVFMCDSARDPTRQAAFLDLLEQQRVEGVIVTPFTITDPHLTRLAERGTPVVVLDVAWPDHCSVAVDDVLGGDLAATHLLESGHRRIAYIGGPMTQPQFADRLTGVHRAMARAGRNEDHLVALATTAADIATGRDAGSWLAGLPARRRPTAAFCANDLLALGLLQQVMQLGLRVPEDVAIVGYDDIEFAEAAAVPLTSVRQPRHDLGVTAAKLLLDEAREGASHQHRHLAFAPELIVRASTPKRARSRRA
jgi:LacI family transcriptional regulator